MGDRKGSGKVGEGKVKRQNRTKKDKQEGQMRIMLANVRGILNKTTEFQNKVNKIDPSFIVVTETHLEEGVLDSELGLQEYNIFRRDRNKRGGGVLVAVKKEFEASLLAVHDDYELMMLNISRKKGNFRLIAGYRPVDNADIGLLEVVSEWADNIPPHTPCLVAGDLNLPGVDWEMGGDGLKGRAINSILALGFKQVVNAPTRINHNGTANILDVILVKPESMWLETVIEKGISDHDIPVLEFEIEEMGCDRKEQSEEGKNIYLYREADSVKIQEHLANKYEAWKENAQDVETLTREYMILCKELELAHIPVKTLKSGGDPPYINKDLKRGRRQCRKLYASYKRGKIGPEQSRDMERNLNDREKVLKSNYFGSMFDPDKRGDSWNKLFKHIRRSKRGHSSIPTLKVGGIAYDSDEKKAQALLKQYGKVFNPKGDTNYFLRMNQGD